MKFLLIVLVGAIAGGILGYVGKCTTGACPLTANPIRGASFGALLGLLVAMSHVGGRGGVPIPVSENIARVSDLNGLQTLIAGSPVPVLVDFYADWCGPCRRLAPELSGLADAWVGHAVIVKVNVDQQREIAASYRISSIPDLRIFSGGKQMQAFTGFRNQADLHQMLVKAGGVLPVSE